MMNVLILEEKEKIIQNPALNVNIYLIYEYMLIYTVLMKGGGGIIKDTVILYPNKFFSRGFSKIINSRIQFT